jgi:diguanylate cyclase (GGDEF)-like protein
MKSNSSRKASDTRAPSPLTDVLEQSREAEGLVVEAADELSAINTALKLELAGQDTPPGIEAALEKSEAVEGKVNDASEKLSIVNVALKGEVCKRHALEDQLTAISEQGDADRHAALHDALTGLPNRTLFHDRLEHGIAQAARHDWPLAVMFVDLDDFKAINDTHGHDVGDSVLRTIASRLSAATRSDDTVSRHGGDEFLYLLMEVADEGDVAAIAEKVIAAIELPCEVSTPQLQILLAVKASVGISIFPRDGATPDELVKAADSAMYEAKQTSSRLAFAS